MKHRYLNGAIWATHQPSESLGGERVTTGQGSEDYRLKLEPATPITQPASPLADMFTSEGIMVLVF